MQKILTADQLEGFYHDQFVKDQVGHFQEIVLGRFSCEMASEAVVDIGGGVGFFASAVKGALGVNIRVVDMDPVSVDRCISSGIDAAIGDAVSYEPRPDESFACFNLILHHLVGKSERDTCELQVAALAGWVRNARCVFVNEYIYESYVDGFSGRAIYEVTSSRTLSALARLISVFIPSFRANTFNVGVRFRSDSEWRALFERAGYNVEDSREGALEYVSPFLRVLLIKSIRRSSYMLQPKD